MISYGNFLELNGLSSDEKPTTEHNGCTFYEMDTGKMYIYDAEHKKWLNYAAPGDEVSY